MLRLILSVKPVRTPLDFGINENVKLINIDNEPRLREGEPISRNTYMQFAKFNADGKRIAQTEFSYFDLQHDSDFVMDNFSQQVGQLNDILRAYGIEDTVIDPLEGYESIEEVEADLRTVKGCKKFMDTMWEQFAAAMKGVYGETSQLMRIKVVTDRNGKYLQLPREIHFIEPVDSDLTLTVTPYELSMYQKGLAPATAEPDAKGDAPEDKPKKRTALINL